MKKLLISVLLFSLVCLSLGAQTYQVGHLQQTFVDATRGNRNISAEIYYPATIAGNNVAIAPGNFPVLLFGHGFVMAWSAYDVIWNALVPNGYIMVFPTTETSFSPSHINFGKDIAFMVGAMKAESNSVSSFFYGAVSSKSAVMGHSMGGGAAFLSMQYDSTITALATLAAAVTNPSSTIAATAITAPTIVFSGVNDCVAPPNQHQIPMYDSLISSCKTLVNITGGSHCQFASINTNCYFGEGTCSPQPTISASAQQTKTFSLLLPWLNFYLKSDCPSAVQFQNLILGSSGITSAQNCSINCATSSIKKELNRVEISIFPTPFSLQTTLSFSVAQTNITVKIIDVLGQTLGSKKFSGKELILEKEELQSGIYFVLITDTENNSIIKKIMVQ